MLTKYRWKTVIFWPCFIFFPTTDFSVSLGRFSRNFDIRRGVFGNILFPLWVFICAPPKNLWGGKPIFADLQTQN